MQRLLTILAVFLLFAQNRVLGQSAAPATLSRPKLVVGIVVDQMRWDYLFRYYDRYPAEGGFKRMLGQGFSCDNTLIPYVPTITACGHTCIYTGSVPAIHGITGNDWYDSKLDKIEYCTEDDSVQTVGSTTDLGKMSPRNLMVTTVTDELRLATNFKSKVIGIAIKDRGGILPAGHSANGAFWYDNKTGDWITSTYYMKELPQWVKDFNAKKMVDKYYSQNWSTLYPLNTYNQSTADDEPYENKPFGPAFPYTLDKFAGKNYALISVTPYGNSMTLEMARAALVGEQLGSSGNCDFLAISLSSTDYIGHTFGPNSVEAEDCYLRLDKDLGTFLDFLDEKVGKGQYLLFLSADHGAAHVPGFMTENKLPGGRLDMQAVSTELNKQIKDKFGVDRGVMSIVNYQVVLDHASIEARKKADLGAIKAWIIDFLEKQPGVARAFPTSEAFQTALPAKIREMVANGYYPSRGGEIQIILDPGWIDGFPKGTTHGAWYPYDAHIPLLWYGWNVKPGKLNREVYMTDISATVAALLHIQMPSGCIGHVIEEVGGGGR